MIKIIKDEPSIIKWFQVLFLIIMMNSGTLVLEPEQTCSIWVGFFFGGGGGDGLHSMIFTIIYLELI